MTEASSAGAHDGVPDGAHDGVPDGPAASPETRSPAQRRQLPESAAELTPLGAGYDEALARGLDEMGLRLDEAVLTAMADQVRLLLAWNQAINLTAIRDREAIARLHVLDSLSALVAVPALAAWRSRPGPATRRAALLDLGSGAGYPGIPLALALPAGRTALVESVAKKARFLEVAAAAAVRRLERSPDACPAFEVLAERSEELAHDEAERERWDIVTARAVGSLAEVLELALPLLRVGGHVLAWKRDGPRGTLAAELAAAGGLARAAGGGRPEVLAVGPPLPEGQRIVCWPKVRPSPNRFPRPPGERRRR